MKQYTIKSGDTFYRLVTEVAKVQLNFNDARELQLYCLNCRVDGESNIPNFLVVGDIIELPTKPEWKAIKERARSQKHIDNTSQEVVTSNNQQAKAVNMDKPFVKKTSEQLEIEAVAEEYKQYHEKRGKLITAGLIVGLPGWLLIVFTPTGSNIEHIGLALFFVSAACWLYDLMIMQGEERSLRRELNDLVAAYCRKQALPFFNELTEMFADKPSVHIHLEEDGRITVTDKRKNKEV